MFVLNLRFVLPLKIKKIFKITPLFPKLKIFPFFFKIIEWYLPAAMLTMSILLSARIGVGAILLIVVPSPRFPH
jgi:hypothetical protein